MYIYIYKALSKKHAILLAACYLFGAIFFCWRHVIFLAPYFVVIFLAPCYLAERGVRGVFVGKQRLSKVTVISSPSKPAGVCVVICMYLCMYVCMYACMYVNMYIHIYIYICCLFKITLISSISRPAGVCGVICMYVCTYVCMYVCMYIVFSKSL